MESEQVYCDFLLTSRGSVSMGDTTMGYPYLTTGCINIQNVVPTQRWPVGLVTDMENQASAATRCSNFFFLATTGLN